MSKPILAGHDPANTDLAPVRFAAAAALATGAPLVIASVVRGGSRDAWGAGQLERDLRDDASAALARVEADLAAHDIDVTCRELRGMSAARALHEAATEQDAALLVVGSTARGALGRVLPGSTAERLLHGAPCPIAVVPSSWQAGHGLRTIGAAYLDSPEGLAALHAAHALARRTGATLRVLTVAHVGIGTYGETEGTTVERAGKGLEAVEGEHRVRAEAAAQAAAAALGGDVEIEVDAFLEDPADSLIRVSEHLDLLVCGSRGYGPLRAVLLGGVSRRVAAAARCPLLVLPRGVDDALEPLLPAERTTRA